MINSWSQVGAVMAGSLTRDSYGVPFPRADPLTQSFEIRAAPSAVELTALRKGAA